MKSIKLNIWSAGLIVMLMMAGNQAEAQRDRGDGYRKEFRLENARGVGDGYGPMSRMESVLDLNDEQKTKIEKFHLDMQKKLLPTMNELREKNAQLNSMISENEGESKINQLIDEISKLQATVRKGHINTHFKVRELLTDEQKIKFDTHSGNKRNGRGSHFGTMGRNGRGRI